jgi:hypothetical protein
MSWPSVSPTLWTELIAELRIDYPQYDPWIAQHSNAQTIMTDELEAANILQQVRANFMQQNQLAMYNQWQDHAKLRIRELIWLFVDDPFLSGCVCCVIMYRDPKAECIFARYTFIVVAIDILQQQLQCFTNKIGATLGDFV